MKDLKIKITGIGDKWMIAQMLHEVAAAVLSTPATHLENGVEWADGILITHIVENDDTAD